MFFIPLLFFGNIWHFITTFHRDVRKVAFFSKFLHLYIVFLSYKCACNAEKRGKTYIVVFILKKLEKTIKKLEKNTIFLILPIDFFISMMYNYLIVEHNGAKIHEYGAEGRIIRYVNRQVLSFT